MPKKKVRTKAERSAAAKASWQLRRLKEANRPTPPTPSIELLPAVDFAAKFSAAALQSTAVATREGDDLFVTISGGGSVYRHRVSAATMRKLGLDCLNLVA